MKKHGLPQGSFIDFSKILWLVDFVKTMISRNYLPVFNKFPAEISKKFEKLLIAFIN